MYYTIDLPRKYSGQSRCNRQDAPVWFVDAGQHEDLPPSRIQKSPRPFARTGVAKYKKARAVGDIKSSSLGEHFTVTQMHPAINRSSFEFDLSDEKACHRLVHFLAARISTRYNMCSSENLEIIHDGKMTTGLRYMLQVRTEAPTPHTGHGCCKRENLPP